MASTYKWAQDIGPTMVFLWKYKKMTMSSTLVSLVQSARKLEAVAERSSDSLHTDYFWLCGPVKNRIAVSQACITMYGAYAKDIRGECVHLRVVKQWLLLPKSLYTHHVPCPSSQSRILCISM